MIPAFIIFVILSAWQMQMNAQQYIQSDSTNIMMDSNSSARGSNLLLHETSYTGDFVNNLIGGKRSGAVYLGIATIDFGIETKRIGLGDGGEFYVKGAFTHGGTPSEKFIGDFQTASNIEAGNHIFLQELWFKQSINNLEITAGLQDLNAQFVSSEYGGSFINSSFGIPPVISDNIPAPIFPLTALGITGKFRLNESFTLQAALFDGLPDSFDKNPYNINWSLSSCDGASVFTELQLSTNFNELPGQIKAGWYFHSHLKEVDDQTGMAGTVFNKNYGFYLISDQKVWQGNDKSSIGLFTQLALSPGNLNMHDFYLGGGINYNGLFNDNSEDSFGLAFAHARFNCGAKKNETTIEMFYKSTITKNFFLQPDIQYIINPAGTENNLPNALAFFMRFGINFY